MIKSAEHADYIALDNPGAAEQWLINLFAEVKRLERFPESSRLVPELNDPNIREIIFKKFRIIYEIKNDHINVLTVRRFKQKFDFDELNGQE